MTGRAMRPRSVADAQLRPQSGSSQLGMTLPQPSAVLMSRRVLRACAYSCAAVGKVGVLGACVKSNAEVRSASSRRAVAIVGSVTAVAELEKLRSMNCRVEGWAMTPLKTGLG